MSSNDDPNVYINIARDFSIGMVLVLLCLNRIAQDMNEHHQRQTRTQEMGNEVPNTPAASGVPAGELNPERVIPNLAAQEQEIRFGGHNTARRYPHPTFSPVQAALRGQGDAELAPYILHEMSASHNLTNHHRTSDYIPSMRGAVLRSRGQSLASDMVIRQSPVELMGVERIQAYGSAAVPVELSTETHSENTERQLPTSRSYAGGNTNNTKKIKRKSWYRKLQNIVHRRESQK
ncbi:hypothetical protein BDZ91DRAFT_789716 [Kalaharituber pfeilii]|nr:hypothetical protein BDZ91DRAFT_789716 [Kalaharituber pfeilii]